MVTPFDENGGLDFAALEALVEWFIEKGVAGLFTVCLSSESFHLTPDERIRLATEVVRLARGRVPVVAGGNFQTGTSAQTSEIEAMADSGVDAVVLLTSTIVPAGESNDLWSSRMLELVDAVNPSILLGLYECPSPSPRHLNADMLGKCLGTGRFGFLKDTTCDAERIREKLALSKDSGLALFNAHTATLLESLRDGADGYSSIMANVVPDLYAWLIDHATDETTETAELQLFLTVANSSVSSRSYPASAKYYLSLEGVPINTTTRVPLKIDFDRQTRYEMDHLHELANLTRDRLMK